MEKSLIFESWRTWKVCFLSGCKHFAWGLMRIVTCIFLGIASLAFAAWRAMVKFVRNYPDISLGAFIVLAGLIWVLTFVSMRAKTVGAEMQRDSIAWQYKNFKKSHGYE